MIFKYNKYFFGDLKSIVKAIFIDKVFLIEVFKTILKSRLLDEATEELYKKGELRRNFFLGYGQEAGGAVISHLLKREDNLIPHYRGYGSVLGKGLPLEKIILEIFGKSGGVAEGKGGSGKFIYPDLNIFSYTSAIGQNFGTAIGMAWAAKYKKEEKVTIIFFGDGATMRGSFFTALNMAAILSVPVLFVCENNQYCVTKRFSESSKTSLEKKVVAFGVRFAVVDGNSPIDIYFESKKLVDFVRKTKSPAFLELNTYRVAGHNIDDLGSYQDKQEREKWLSRDPIEMLLRIFSRTNMVTNREINLMIKEIKKEIYLLIKLAKTEKEIDFASLEKEIYA